ncbi:hypothetical protein OHT76_00825 [Streptomyces sp. NBC_00287]|uniref:hypothetical protein n=1 Tax=Streptomyces sp. NBC_00287 TaxID=2975702 RepID=UPI002E297FE9|nr:hypothetical protein [Streptomyces sp. NBC_00287]
MNGREVNARSWRTRSSAVNYYGSITVDYEHELAQLDEKGHRPPIAKDLDDAAEHLKETVGHLCEFAQKPCRSEDFAPSASSAT